jgi:hypothetical protein
LGVLNRVADTSAAPGLNRFGRTQRRDAWFLEILPTLVVFSAFLVYATWRAFEGKFYWAAPYLSPFYSPLIDPNHHWWPLSPAVLILGGPAGFRFTCYYYRKAYYRAFVFHPPACAVGEERHGNYRGEAKFPLILQNVHRYFFYVVTIFLCFLWYDAVMAFRFPNGFGVGVGSIIMLVNVILLTTYSASCHSLRHLVGGKLDCFSCASFGAPRHGAWSFVTKLNEHHMFWAWMSLFSVALTDLYIRLVSAGIITDFRIL